MKVNYTTFDGRMSVEVEGDGQKAIWEQLSDFQEVFDEKGCGKCGSQNLRFRVRTAMDAKKKTIKYYLRVCGDCNAKLNYGCHAEGGTIFPKRFEKDEETGKSSYIGKNGWVKFNKETNEEE